MPYKAFKQGNQYCVYKLDSSDNKTGGSLGCHSSKDKANKQVAALYASENKEVDMEKENMKARDIPEDIVNFYKQMTDEDLEQWGKMSDKEKKEMYADYYGEIHDTNDYVPYGVTSFEKYDEIVAARKLAEATKKDVKVFKKMVDNAVDDDMIEDSPNVIIKLAKELGARINKRTSGIYSLFNKPAKIEDDMPKEKNFDAPFMVFKDKDGIPKWITRYSNIYRDQDYPPEIISKQSHEYFEEMIDKGIVPMPELWVWHMPLRIGETEVVTFDKENGIAIAMGSFDDNDAAKEFAQILMDNPDDWGVSHGMPGQFIERSKEDPTVITKHITKEISVLPKYAAANKWADFAILKEVDMTIKQEKFEQLKAHGVSPEVLQDLESGNKELATALEELGIESKEATEEIVDEKEAEAEVVEEVEETKEADEPIEDEQKEADEVDLQKQMVDAIKEIGTIMRGFNDRLVQLEEKQVEEKEAKVEIPEDLPPMALKEMLFQAMNFKDNSVRESEDAVIDGRTGLAKAKPAEKEAEDKPRIVETGNPLLNDVLSNVVLGNEQPA